MSDDFSAFEQCLYSLDQYVLFPLKVKWCRFKRQLRQKSIEHPLIKEVITIFVIVISIISLAYLLEYPFRKINH